MVQPVVIDTNIVFAALRSNNEKIRDVLTHPSYKFYAPNFLIAEIFHHKERILAHSSASEEKAVLLLSKLLHKITFVSEDVVSLENYIAAYRLCGNIDEKDTPFVALALELNAMLWTNDEVLRVGLIKKGFSLFFRG